MIGAAIPFTRETVCLTLMIDSKLTNSQQDTKTNKHSHSTGMKCLPQSKLRSANGTVLHDWHAEVLAIRALNHFILQECKAVLAAEGDPHHPCDSPYIRRRTKEDDDGSEQHRQHQHQHQQPFFWREDVSLHMYCSEAPCGDASMELTMSAQEDTSPWESPLPPHLLQRKTLTDSLTAPPTSSTEAEIATISSSSSLATAATPDLLLLGRACFSHLGVVRRKPARPDAPPTLSKSCSDKLAMRQCTSLLSSVVSLLVAPTKGVYLRSLVVPETQYSATGCARCFSAQGRMASLVHNGEEKEGGYAFQPFEIETTSLEFSFSRRGGGGEGEGEVKYVASNLSTAWSANGLAENIIGGVLQGRKQTDPRGGSQVSRVKMWTLAGEVAEMVAAAADRDDDIVPAVPSSGTYYDLKGSQVLYSRRRVKERVVRDALKGWVKNVGDEGFALSIRRAS